MFVDLHLHTHYSDGSWSPQDLIDRAVKLGFACIAVTDHDTTAGIAECIEHAGERIRVIPGIELNTVWKREDGSLKDVHILGYFIDVSSPAIEEVNIRQNQARQIQLEECLSRLNRGGFNVDLNLVKSFAGKGTIGRPHLSMALLDTGAVDNIEKAYNMLTQRSSEFYVPRLSISPFEAIDAIHAAGGVASWAHPGKDKEVSTILPLLRAHELDAIEAYHRSYSHRLTRKYLKLARDTGLLVSGGSDCHGPYKQYSPVIGSVRVPLQVVKALEQRARSFSSS